MKKGSKAAKRILDLMLTAVLALGLILPADSEVYAQDKVDIGSDPCIEYLTSFVYPASDGSDEMTGEIRLVDTRDYHILTAGTDVSFSYAPDGSGSYDLTVTALESSDKYTGSFTCKPDLVGIGAPVRKSSSKNGTWTYVPYEILGGWTSCAVIRYTAGTSGKANLASVEDSLDEASLDLVMPGSVYNQGGLTEAVLGETDYMPYIFVNCPAVKSISMLLDEFTAPSNDHRDIKPVHMGPITAENDEGGEKVNKIKLIVNRKAKWTDEDGNVILTMDRFCNGMYSDYYIMDVNAKEFTYRNWLIRVAMDSYGDAAEFTILKYKPADNDTSAWNVTSLTLPDTIVFNGDEYVMSDGDADCSVETNVFDGLPELKQINTGKYMLTAPLANDCPKLQKIVTELTEEDVDEELGIWQEDCENLKYLADLQPLVNGELSGCLELVANANFPWMMEEPLTNAQGQYIDPQGNVTEDPDEADYTVYTLTQYCAKFGYSYAGASISDVKLRINAHNSMMAIAGNNAGGRPLALSLWMSYDPASWDDYDSEWVPAAGGFGFTLSDWSVEAVQGSEDILDKVSLDAANGTLTVDPSLDRGGAVRLSCTVTDSGSGEAVSVSSDLDVLPRFQTDALNGAYLYIDDKGNTRPETGQLVPFILNRYDWDSASETYAGVVGDELCEAYSYYPSIFYNDGQPVPETEAFHPDNGVTGEISLADYDEGGKPASEIAQLASVDEGQPLYLILAKPGAAERDRFTVNASFTYNGDRYELSQPMMVTKGYRMSDEDKALIPEDGTLLVGVFAESYSANLANTIAQMYPDLEGKVRVEELDEDEWTDRAVAYSDYMEGIEYYLMDETAPEDYPDIIIWPSYMLKDQQGGPAAAAFEDLGIKLSGNGYSRYGAASGLEKKDGKTYAAATSFNPGGFVYNKAAAKAVLGTDDPAEVQKYLSSWDKFVDVMARLKAGEEYAGGSLRVKGSDESDLYMLSSLDNLSEAVMQGNSVLNESGGISLGESVLDYFTIRQKLEDAGAVGSDADLLNGKAFGCFATELDTIVNTDLAAGIADGTLDVVRGPASFAGEGTELATVTGVKGSAAMNSFAGMFLKHMLTDTNAMTLAYEDGTDRFGSRFSNNMAWQAALDSSETEGLGIRAKWNMAAGDISLPESEAITSYVADYLGDKWNGSIDTSINRVYSGLNESSLMLPVIEAVSDEHSSVWKKKHYVVDRTYDEERINRFDMHAPYEDPETGAPDAEDKDRFDRGVAASVVAEDGTETYFYSLTRAVEAFNEEGGKSIRLYKDMTYSDCPFDIFALPLDLNGRTIKTPQGTLPEKQADPSQGGSGAAGGQTVAAPSGPAEIIDLPAVKISKPKAAKKKLTVKWKKPKKKKLKKIKGVQIQVATDPGFTNIVKTAKAGKKKTSKVIKGLKPKTKYYVRIRAYGAPNHYSVWKSKSGKTK